GVPKGQQHVLTLSQARQITGTLADADPTKTDVGPQLDGIARRYGQAWPKVFGDLVTLGKLSPQYQTLATISDPAARADFQRMLATAAEKGGTEKLKD